LAKVSILEINCGMFLIRNKRFFSDFRFLPLIALATIKKSLSKNLERDF
jgi:hypothetical protein